MPDWIFIVLLLSVVIASALFICRLEEETDGGLSFSDIDLIEEEDREVNSVKVIKQKNKKKRSVKSGN